MNDSVMPIWPPAPGFYATQLVRNGPLVPLRIWYGAPILDGEELDRSHRWCVEVEGRTERVRDGIPELLDVTKFWPWCARRPIPRHEYDFLMARRSWAAAHAPNHPAAKSRERIDFNTIPVRL